MELARRATDRVTTAERSVEHNFGMSRISSTVRARARGGAGELRVRFIFEPLGGLVRNGQ